MSRPLYRLLLTTSALVPLGASIALANPQGGQVVGGAATIQGQGSPSVTVTQSTPRAIINWQTFNIGLGETTRFVQPSAASVMLNRVVGGFGPSLIEGMLTANGQVYLVNPDGIMIGKDAKVDTASFLATTHDISNADFMAGRNNFTISGKQDASVINQGTITAQMGGFAALVAPGVRNTGTITANLGKVALASGNGFTLDFYGDRLVTLGVDDSVAAKVTDVSTGKPLKALVSNEGTIKADGGRVELTAVAARRVVDAVINNAGVIEANSIGARNGMIVLGAATDATKPAGAPAQVVKVSGKLSVAGKQTGTTGGKIQITGESIHLAGAAIDASGRAGGGKVLIGGDTGGGKPSAAAKAIMVAALESAPVPTASNVSIDYASVIDVSANDVGDGGKAIVWSDFTTDFAGRILARGGAQSGNGGFVETSSHGDLAFTGNVDVAALNGIAGTLLLDPRNVTIGTTGPWVVTPTAIQNALATGNVIVSTDAAGTDAGDITVAQNVSWSTSNILQLSAHRNITINDGVTISNTHAGSGNPPILLLLVADRSGTGVGTVNFIGSGKVDFSQSSHGVFILYNPPLASSHVLTSPSSPGLYARMRVGDLSDLNGIVPDINSNPQTPLPPNTTRMTGGPGTPPSSALSTPILVASVERLAVPQDAFANGQQKVNFQSVIYTTVAGSTAASLLLDAALILPQTGSASPSSRRPAQWLIDDVRNAYASSPSDIKVIAQNAPYAFLAENAYSVPNVGDKIKVLGDSWEVVDVGGIRNGDPGMSATVFRNEKTREVVVAFRGTVNLEAGIEHDTDYGLVNGANINSLIVMQAAERFAELMQQKYGSVTFVGHSLGGAMAQYAAVTLGSNVNAVAFDSAPLGPSLLAGKLGVPSMTGVSANAVQSSGRSFAAQVLGKQYDNITNFRGPNDPVTSWASSFSGFITGDAAPQIGPAAIVIRNAPSAPASLLAPERTIDTIRFNHAMDNIANAAGAVRLAEPWLGAGR